MRKIIVLGNCISERLAILLDSILSHINPSQPDNQWEVIRVSPIYNVKGPQDWKKQAELAKTADIIFTQPLFNFGPCNTKELLASNGDKTHVFSAPNFEAYFPDCLEPGTLSGVQQFAPPIDWHSKIILQCRAAGIPSDKVPEIWLNHPLFEKKKIRELIDSSMARYEKHEQNVEIGTLDIIKDYYNKEALFFTFRHPGDRIFKRLLSGMLRRLNYSTSLVDNILKHVPFHDDLKNGDTYTEWGFGFNAWPIITGRHDLFNFPSRDWFRIGGKKIDLATAAKLWYFWYEAHPEQFAQALDISVKT